MAGMAGGFAQGYADTALKLQQLQQTKDQDDQRLAVQKENLALQRDVLKGQEASRKLQDDVHLQTLLRLQKEYKDNLATNLAVDRNTGAVSPPAAGEITQTTLTPSSQPPPSASTAQATPTGGQDLTGVQRLMLYNANKIGLDPALALAVPHQESGFAMVPGDGGNSRGYYQVQAKAAQDVGTDPATLDDPWVNIHTGQAYLKKLLDAHGGDVNKALQQYNSGRPDGSPAYAKSVQALQAQYQARLGSPPTPDTSQQMAGPGAPTAPSTTSATNGSAPTSPPQGERLSEQAIQVALASNPLRQELAQKTQALAVVEAQRDSLQKEPAANKNGAAYKQREAELDKQHADLTNRRTQLEDRLQPKTPEDYAILDRTGLAPVDLQYAGPGLLTQARAAVKAQETTTTEKAKDDFKRTQPLQEAQQEHASLFRDVTTGQPIDPTMPYGQALQRQSEGTVKKVTPKQQERLETMESGLAIVQQVAHYVQVLYGPEGILAEISSDPGLRQLLGSKIGLEQLNQQYPVLTAATRFIEANTEGLARTLQGVRGAGTEGDVARASQGLPQLQAALNFSIWPPKINVAMPDTRGVALRVLDDLRQVLDKQAGTILGNPQFHYPGLPAPLVRPEDTPGATGRPGAPPPAAPAAPAAQGSGVVDALQRTLGDPGAPGSFNMLTIP